jgi:hypothetical protein
VVTTIGMGLASDRLQVDVVDGIAGMDLVRDLGVSGVPTVVLDDRLLLDNPSPDESLLDFVLSRRSPAAPTVPFRACGRLSD